MTLRTDLAGNSSRVGHAAQHDEANAAILALQEGGGTSVLSKLDAESQPALAVTQADGAVQITGWLQDSVVGADASVNGDGIHFDLTAGTYLVNVLAQLVAAGDATAGRIVLGGGTDGNYADAGPQTGWVPRIDMSGYWNIQGAFWFHMSATGQVNMAIAIAGGAGTGATINYAGIDLVRLGS